MEPNTGSLLLWAFQAFERELFVRLQDMGHRSLRPKHGAVLANVDAGGTRPSVLAERAGMTKASMGELVDELERLGYVVRRPDPSDGRAKLVVPTATGIDAIRAARNAIEEVERGYRRALGDRRYRALRTALRTVCEPVGEPQPRIR